MSDLILSSPLKGEVPTLVGGGGETTRSPLSTFTPLQGVKPTFPLKGKGGCLELI